MPNKDVCTQICSRVQAIEHGAKLCVDMAITGNDLESTYALAFLTALRNERTFLLSLLDVAEVADDTDPIEVTYQRLWQTFQSLHPKSRF